MLVGYFLYFQKQTKKCCLLLLIPPIFQVWCILLFNHVYALFGTVRRPFAIYVNITLMIEEPYWLRFSTSIKSNLCQVKEFCLFDWLLFFFFFNCPYNIHLFVSFSFTWGTVRYKWIEKWKIEWFKVHQVDCSSLNLMGPQHIWKKLLLS